jgi:RNA polymerase sigma-70 factor (ECF subfamily)
MAVDRSKLNKSETLCLGGELTSEGKSAERLSDWFSEWQLPLRRFLARRRAGSTADIDDIAQEVFLRVLRYDRSEFVDRPQSYLFQIAANVSSEWAVRSSRTQPHDSAWLEELVDSISPESELEREGVAAQLLLAIERLPLRAQEILRLHFDGGMTYAEIALAMGVTRKIVQRDLARAYAWLRTNLDCELFGMPKHHGAKEST